MSTMILPAKAGGRPWRAGERSPLGEPRPPAEASAPRGMRWTRDGLPSQSHQDLPGAATVATLPRCGGGAGRPNLYAVGGKDTRHVGLRPRHRRRRQRQHAAVG